MKNLFRRTAPFLFLLVCPPVSAVGPMYSSHDLVAGEGMGGFEDGPFYSALFNTPTGIALDPTDRKLYVADQQNHCLRVIDLSRDNLVSTLTGQGKPGYADGPLEKAAFSQPSLLVALPGRRLAVWDKGNNRIRLVDLDHKTVSTLAGGTGGDLDGTGEKAQIGSIWSMAYLESQDAIYFSQPVPGVLRRLSLKTGEVTTLVKGDTRIPKPGALCVHEGKIYVADRELAQGYELTPKGDKGELNWSPVVCRPNTLCLAWSDGLLYSLQADSQNPFSVLLYIPRPIRFYNPWGEKSPLSERDSFLLDAVQGYSMGLVPDPTAPRRFYIVHPLLNIVTSVRDLDEDETMDNEGLTNGLMDFHYPDIKPPHVFRILFVGDSHLFHNDNPDGTTLSHNRMALAAKRLENDLNIEAAAEDKPERFEVLTLAHVSSVPLNLWPYYEVPPVVQKYDIDLVLYLMIPFFDNRLELYLQRPMKGDHIPAENIDPEYLLKPARKKSLDPAIKELADLCAAKKLATIGKEGEIQFAGFYDLNADPVIRSKITELYTRPLRTLRQKLLGLRGSKGPTPLITCLMPAAHFASYRAGKPIWMAAANEIGGPVMDLSDPWTAFRVSYYPLSELGGFDHYNGHGHELLAFLIAHELIGHQWIPWETPKPDH